MNQPELSAIQQLDVVLRLLYNDKGNARLSYIKERLLVENNIKLDGEEITRILNKLIKEGYVEHFDRHLRHHDPYTLSPEIDRHYWISFEGKLLIETVGSYEQKIKNDAAENSRLIKAERATRILTIILAFGALIAAVYYCTELYWKYHWFHWFKKP